MYPIFIYYQSVTVYTKNKKERSYIIVSKKTLHFKYVSKEYTKQRQTKKIEIKKKVI